MSQAIRRVSLQTEIIKYICDYIKEHDLQPEDKLPSQGQFMEMMGVSRTALREAIKTLEARHIIVVRNGKGLYVGASDEKKDIVGELLGFTEEKEQLIETLEVRQIMEKAILEMVIEKASEKELDELEELKTVLMDKFYAGEVQTEEDRAFHHKIYSMCHNQVMYALIRILDEHMSRFWQFPLDIEDPFRESMPYHETLYDAIRERNVVKAQKENQKLLKAIYKEIIDR